MALNLIGEPLGPHELAGAGGMPPAGGGPNHPAADVAMDMGVDSKTAAKIRELRAQKEAAVSAEDYDEAKRIKVAMPIHLAVLSAILCSVLSAILCPLLSSPGGYPSPPLTAVPRQLSPPMSPFLPLTHPPLGRARPLIASI